MIYNQDDINRELVRYFNEDVKGNNQDIIENTRLIISQILSSTSVIHQCREIRDSFVNIYNERKFLPTWIKYLVYVVIYNYLENNKTPKYTQSYLLEEMGLYADIFGKKNWCMYSPDMKIRQAKYTTTTLPLNHAEVESNEIFRAMIHYMVCYSAVYTDTFVDMFGKLGLVPALCANGYTGVQVWLDEKNYKELLIFASALEKSKKVSKILDDYIYSIKTADDKIAKTQYYIGQAMVNEIKVLNNMKIEVEIYQFAALYIIQQYFTPEYWLDGNLMKLSEELEEYGAITSNNTNSNTGGFKECLTTGLKDNLTANNIANFTRMKFYNSFKSEKEIKDFKKNGGQLINLEILSKAYKAKRFSPIRVKIKEKIDEMFDECNYEYSHEIESKICSNALLYIDIPKYLREDKRFDFDIVWYLKIFSILKAHKGDWILTWKNYVEFSSDRLGKQRVDSIYNDIYTQDKIIPSVFDYNNPSPIGGYKQNRMAYLYKILGNISKDRQLYVFRYKDCDKNHPNSIIFITTINIPNITCEEFELKYNVELALDAKLEVKTFEKFRSTCGV